MTKFFIFECRGEKVFECKGDFFLLGRKSPPPPPLLLVLIHVRWIFPSRIFFPPTFRWRKLFEKTILKEWARCYVAFLIPSTVRWVKRDTWTNRRMDQLTNERTDRPSTSNKRKWLPFVWTFELLFHLTRAFTKKDTKIARNGSFLCSIRGPIKLRAYFWPSMFKLGFILIVVLTFSFKIERTTSLHPSKCPWKHTIC